MRSRLALTTVLLLVLSGCDSTDGGSADADRGPTDAADGVSSGAGGGTATDGSTDSAASGEASGESGGGAGDGSVGGDTGGGTDGGTDGDTGSGTDGGTDGIVDPGGDTGISEPVDPTPLAPVQPGTLTAGDHDDQLNAELYQRYASAYVQAIGRTGEQTSGGADVPYVDLSRRVALHVTDADGTPFAAAHVRLAAQGETLLELITPTDGTVYVYPDLDALPDAFELEVGDRLGDVRSTVNVALADLDGARRVDVALPAVNVAADALDLLLVIDTTGSMGDELDYLKAELSSILGRIDDANPELDTRVGLVLYRDDGDAYVVRTHAFTDDIATAQASLDGETHDGGGDYPEAMDQALVAALGLGWREQSAKILLLVADAPPHAERTRATFESAMAARSRQIHVVPVAASGVADEAEYLMRAMAAVTHARYLFLTDDSGVGNPHAEPTIACYLVTRLDGLIVRVVESLVGGERIEPSEAEIVRRVGNYDRGRCLADAP